MKRIFALLLCFSMVLSMICTISYAKEFPDVDSSHWAIEYISKLSDEGVINGYDDGTYRPEGTVKRSEFLKLVMAAVWPSYLDLEEVPAPFDHWAAPYVGLAEIDGVLEKGEYTLENIEEPITRIEMAKIIAKADMYEKYNSAQYGEQLGFLDIGELDTEDRLLLTHAYVSGLIKGYDNGTFKPNKTMTRAEAATMIYRFTAK